MPSAQCIFCKIIAGEIEAARVYENDRVIVFLDNTPLFPGHCLVCPKEHYETLMDVPQDWLEGVFATAQTVARAVESGLGAEGSFVAINNKVSQTVPHLHVHVVPRRRGDGLKGFFWPRRKYRDNEEMAETQQILQRAIKSERSV